VLHMSVPDVPDDSEVQAYVTGTTPFESSDAALEKLVQIKEIDFGDVFTNRDTTLESEMQRGISITFFHDEFLDHLHFAIDDEDKLTINLRLDDDRYQEFDTIHSKILERLSTITVEDVMITKEFDFRFSSLDVPISDETELDIRGVKVRHGGVDYIIQEQESEGIVAFGQRTVDRELTQESSENVLESELEDLDRFVQEVL